MAILSIPAGNVIEGENTLKIWAIGDTPGTLVKIQVRASSEAQILSDSFDTEGGLIGVAQEGTSVGSHGASRQSARYLIADMESDQRLSPGEKATWRQSWHQINIDYTKLVAYAATLSVDSTELVGAHDSLRIFLTNAGVWSHPAETYLLVGSTMSDVSQAYANAYRDLVDNCNEAYTEEWSEEGATNDSAWRAAGDTTKIDGGKIHAGSTIIVGNTVDGDYCEITDGDIDFWQYIGDQHVHAKSLKRLEVGTAMSGVTKDIPGVFRNPPKVFVSPNNVPTYDHTHSDQSQTLHVSASDIQQPANDGHYTFMPKAELIFSAGSTTVGGSGEKELSQNGPTTISFYSDQIALPAGTRSVTASGSHRLMSFYITYIGGVYKTVFVQSTSVVKAQLFYGGAWHDGTEQHFSGQGQTFNFSVSGSAGSDITYMRLLTTVTTTLSTAHTTYGKTTWDTSRTDTTSSSVLLSGSLNYAAIGE